MTDGAAPDNPQRDAEGAGSEDWGAIIERVLATLDDSVLGQRVAAEALLATYIGGGHALLEGVPGIGKTLLARAFSASLGVRFQRVQFTPDLTPSDVIGANVFEQETRQFRLMAGPIFTQILMADEINRTPPKTQSALLEAMQERQVTIDGTRHGLDAAFFVVATQNPIELEGTYPLPEAQLDRFLTRIQMTLPDPSDEVELYRRWVDNQLHDGAHASLPEAVVSPEQASALRGAARDVHVSDELLDYVLRLAVAIRASELLELSVSPRGALALLETARSAALIDGRDYVVPDDLKRFLEPCWGHRIILTAEAELEGHKGADVLSAVASSVEVPLRAKPVSKQPAS